VPRPFPYVYIPTTPFFPSASRTVPLTQFAPPLETYQPPHKMKHPPRPLFTTYFLLPILIFHLDGNCSDTGISYGA
jgi:hypothetical protein